MAGLLRALILVFFLAPGMAAGQPEKPPLDVLYIANEGFLIECAGKKIVIDGLFGGFESPWYYTPPDSAVEQMKTAGPPFDSIDVICVTHWHRDHFDAGIVSTYMKNNPRAVLVSTPQVADKLAAFEDYAEIKDRVRMIPAPGDSAVGTEIAGVKLVVFPTRHGPYMETDSLTGEKIDRHRDVQHLEFLITVAGRKMYHGGDGSLNAFEMYRASGLAEAHLDLAFLSGRTRGLFTTDRLIVMHLSPGRESKPLPEDYKREAPVVIAARQPMVRWTFH